MDFAFDNFISYPKSPEDFPQTFSEEEDLFPSGYLSTPDMNQWGSFPSDSLQTNTNSPPTSDSYTPKLPFTIIRPKSNQELKQVSGSTKLIKKKQKAKERAERKEQEISQILAKASKKYIPPALYDPTLDPKTKRHLVQVVKNRMAAQQSRDKKRAEVGEFDEVKRRLEDENRRLLEQNSYLMDRIKQMEENQMKILAENEHLRGNNHRQHQAIDSSFASQKSMTMTMDNSKQIVIDISDEERTQGDLVCESPMGPVISRGSKKRTPFGYLFSLTTILMVFQTLTINPVSEIGPKHPPKNPGDDTGVIITGALPTDPTYHPPGPDGPDVPEPDGPTFGPPPTLGPTDTGTGTGTDTGTDTTSPDSTGPAEPHAETEMAFGGHDEGGERTSAGSGSGSETDSGGSETDNGGTETESGSEVKALFKNETLDASGNNEGEKTDNSTSIDPEFQSPTAQNPELSNGDDTSIDTSGSHDENDAEAFLMIDNGDNQDDKEVDVVERSSNTNRLLQILDTPSSETPLGSALRRPKRLLESLYDAINTEPERRKH